MEKEYIKVEIVKVDGDSVECSASACISGGEHLSNLIETLFYSLISSMETSEQKLVFRDMVLDRLAYVMAKDEAYKNEAEDDFKNKIKSLLKDLADVLDK